MIDVAVTFIRKQDKILLVYNEEWGGYTLPMTKRRRSEASDADGWLDAAARNVVECLGRPSAPQPMLKDVLPDSKTSRRQIRKKKYRHKVFVELFRDNDRVATQAPVIWATPQSILAGRYRPISPTALELVGYDAVARHLAVPVRKSEASIALIQLQKDGQTEWLAQWNDNWAKYFFVGGHRQAGESFPDCMIREMREELSLEIETGYVFPPARPSRHVYFTAFSESAQELTLYSMELYPVELLDAAHGTVFANSDNRWLTEDEINDEQAADGKPVSETIKRLLRALLDLEQP